MPRAKPTVANKGAFDALQVEGSDDSEPEVVTPPSPSPSKPSTPLSVSTKKGRAKQRARDRARKQIGDEPDGDAVGANEEASSSVGAGLAAELDRQREKSETPRPVNGTPAQVSGGGAPPAAEVVELDPPKAVNFAPQPSAEHEAPPMARTGTADSTLLTSATVSATTSTSVTPLSSDGEEDDTDADYTGTEAEKENLMTPKVGSNKNGRFAEPTSPTGTVRGISPLVTRGPSPPPTVKAESRTAKQQNYGSDHDPKKKWQSVVTRITWSLVMVSGFIGLMMMGHVYLIILVFALQGAVFREVSNLFEVGYKASAREHVRRTGSSSTREGRREKRLRDVEKDRWSKVMSWYFFCVANYFLYGESIIYYFKHVVFIDAYLLPFVRHHRFISLILYLAGFLTFVANLDRDHLRRQFGLFSWIHMSLLLVVVSSHFMVCNILEGLIWFWVPASLVIMNDVAAYVFGMLFGRHQLIQLSPKKTIEGFVGGYFATVVFAYIWGSIFQRWNYMICPVRDLGVTALSNMDCVPNSAFAWHSFALPDAAASLLTNIAGTPIQRFWWTPFQLHTLVLGTFAGLVAPFGGFFASGFKRAFNIKDFGDTIPGHGGLTDRFDCQFIMGLFTYFYYSSLVREHHVTVGSVLEIIMQSLSAAEQVELLRDLQSALTAQGIKWT